MIGFTLFTLAVLYVVSKRIGILKMQRKLTSAIKSGSLSSAFQKAVPVNIPNHPDPDVGILPGRMHDEL